MRRCFLKYNRKKLTVYKCKKCESNEYVKAGFVKGEQRYKCKKCGCQFVPTRHKGRINFPQRPGLQEFDEKTAVFPAPSK